MDSSRKLRRQLGYEIAKLHGLQESVDLTRDDASAKALAGQIRAQAGSCLGLLDQYQSSVPSRMWSDAERRCRPLRDDLKRTEMLFRTNAGEWEGRTLTRTDVHRICDWTWDDLAGPQDGPAAAARDSLDEQTRTDLDPSPGSSGEDVEAHQRRDLAYLMAIDDEVEHDRAPATEFLRFTLPGDGDSCEQNMLVLVPGATGLVYEHQCGGPSRRRMEIEGFLVPAWAQPEATEALDHLFAVVAGGNGILAEGEARTEAVRTVGEAVERIWYRGTGERLAALRIDEARLDELDDAWVPVLTPDGPAYLTWVTSERGQRPRHRRTDG